MCLSLQNESRILLNIPTSGVPLALIKDIDIDAYLDWVTPFRLNFSTRLPFLQHPVDVALNFSLSFTYLVQSWGRRSPSTARRRRPPCTGRRRAPRSAGWARRARSAPATAGSARRTRSGRDLRPWGGLGAGRGSPEKDGGFRWDESRRFIATIFVRL